MSKYQGLFTFDIDSHRYIPVGQADGIIDCMDYIEESGGRIKNRSPSHSGRLKQEVDLCK